MLTRSMLSFGEVVNSPYADIAVKVDPGDTGVNITLDDLEMQNVDSAMLVMDENGELLLMINVTDPSRGAKVFIPAHAYKDVNGNTGSSNQTLTLDASLYQHELTQQAQAAQSIAGALLGCHSR